MLLDNNVLAQLSTKLHSRSVRISPEKKSIFSEKQRERLNRHRAKQRDWPSPVDTLLMPGPEKKRPSCIFGRSTTSRPCCSHASPLKKSVHKAMQEKLHVTRQRRLSHQQEEEENLPRFKHYVVEDDGLPREKERERVRV